jgi:excisionase family DNA binding protein
MDTDFSDANGSPQLLLTIDQVAKRLGICRAKLYVHLAAGDIRALKIGRRTAIARTEVEAFIARLPVARFRKPAGQ